MLRQTSRDKTADLRRKIAQEAAHLLYFGLEKEYKQAKVKAAENLGAHVLPSNLEIALELDKVAQETEGPARTARLTQMRIEALKIMKMLNTHSPLLIGSVWRGTIRRGSDIDVEVYHDIPEEIVELLKKGDLKVLGIEKMTVTENGKTESSFHAHATSGNYEVEVVVRSPEEAGRKRVCDTFGDQIKGLNLHELAKLLKTDPTKNYIPS